MKEIIKYTPYYSYMMIASATTAAVVAIFLRIILSTTTIIITTTVKVTDALTVEQSLFDICEYHPPKKASVTCVDKPPCKFCVKILSQNSVYRVSDILIHSGPKWDLDARHILDKEEYNHTFLHDVITKNGIHESSGDQNIAEMRQVITKRAMEVLTDLDKIYLVDKETALIYLRAGDRIDHVPIALFAKRIIDTGAKRVVLSFVMHFGQWTVEDMQEKHRQARVMKWWAFNQKANVNNYIYIWQIVQHIRTTSPGIEIVIRSNENPDQDLALYVLASNFISVSFQGFERLLIELRNSSKGAIDSQVESYLASRGVSKTWIQYGEHKTGGTAQTIILLGFGWLLYGYDGVALDHIKIVKQPQNNTMHTVASNIIATTGKLVISTHVDTTVLDAYKGRTTDGLTLFGSVRMSAVSASAPAPVTSSSGSTGSVFNNYHFAYVQNYEDLLRDGIGPQVDEYVHNVFNISDSLVNTQDINALKHWIELVYISRQCCGASMEESWRKFLHSFPVTQDASLKATGHNSNKISSTHRCLSYNFTAVEMELERLEAHLFLKLLTKVGSCECSIKKTIKENLQPDDTEAYGPCEGTLDSLLRQIRRR